MVEQQALLEKLRAFRYRVHSLSPGTSRLAIVAFSRDLLGFGRRSPQDAAKHLRAAIEWLCAAQDATPDGGVARSFNLRPQPSFPRRGWVASYPETTGYIIPTFLEYANWRGLSEIRERARRMADWECDVQLPSGAVRGGTVDFPPSPAVFNTGQVIFGLARAYQEFQEPRYRECAIRAGDYLLSVQDPDGAWRRGGSLYAAGAVHTYDTRTAWSLLKLYDITGNRLYREACLRNIDFALAQQQPNGWFANNCLSDETRPLVHTIAYSIRGILESGVFLKVERFVIAARKAADALLDRQRTDGSLSGRYDAEWRPAAGWSCLTGNSQMALIWFRLHLITREEKYRQAALSANQFQMSVQNLTSHDRGMLGGIKGSHPVYGDYGTYEYLNWATKFFVDALMLELRGDDYAGDHG